MAERPADDRLRKWIARHRRVFALTGAGCSTASGIPDYRDDDGEWKRRPPVMFQAFRTQDAIYRRYWARGYAGWTRFTTAVPGAAHRAFAAWESAGTLHQLVTQNVDGLHTRAGSREVLELHGNINRSYCTNCEKRFQMKAEDVPHKPEICDKCSANVRPDVVLFGETLPFGVFQKAERRARECDLFFVVGTSALVYPAAGLAEIAKFSGAFLVEVNPEETPMTGFCDFTLRGKAGEILPILDFGH